MAKNYKSYILLDKTASTGVGTVVEVKDFQQLILGFVTGAGTLTIKIVGSVQEDKPAFDSNAGLSYGNHWDYVGVIDLQSGNTIAGDTGISVTGGSADSRLLKVPQIGLKWLSASLVSWTSGSVKVVLFATNNN